MSFFRCVVVKFERLELWQGAEGGVDARVSSPRRAGSGCAAESKVLVLVCVCELCVHLGEHFLPRALLCSFLPPSLSLARHRPSRQANGVHIAFGKRYPAPPPGSLTPSHQSHTPAPAGRGGNVEGRPWCAWAGSVGGQAEMGHICLVVMLVLAPVLVPVTLPLALMLGDASQHRKGGMKEWEEEGAGDQRLCSRSTLLVLCCVRYGVCGARR